MSDQGHELSQIPSPAEALSYFGFDTTGRLIKNGCVDVALRAGGVVGGMGYCNNMIIGNRCPVTFDTTNASGPDSATVPIQDVCRQALLAARMS